MEQLRKSLPNVIRKLKERHVAYLSEKDATAKEQQQVNRNLKEIHAAHLSKEIAVAEAKAVNWGRQCLNTMDNLELLAEKHEDEIKELHASYEKDATEKEQQHVIRNLKDSANKAVAADKQAAADKAATDAVERQRGPRSLSKPGLCSRLFFILSSLLLLFGYAAATSPCRAILSKEVCELSTTDTTVGGLAILLYANWGQEPTLDRRETPTTTEIHKIRAMVSQTAAAHTSALDAINQTAAAHTSALDDLQRVLSAESTKLWPNK
jgi:hypothetical protein